jgi:GNAT superfamily N-acetyltransferase
MLPDLQLKFRHLTRGEWQVLRDMRLNALHESPLSFLAKYDQEEKYSPERWQAEFDRGDWIVGELDGEHVCLTGVTRESGAPADERYLEYMWLTHSLRGKGRAFDMLTEIISELKDYGVRTIFLWTLLNDNKKAQSLYERLLFSTTNEEKLDDDPEGRWWERLRRDLI